MFRKLRPEPLLVTPDNERAAAFSPDGRWFAYVSDESGRDEVYVRAFPDTGRRVKISSDGGTEPVWKRDGGELFYRHGDSMMAVGFTTEPDFRAERPKELFKGSYLLDPYGNPQYDVTPDGRRFLMVRGQSAPPAQLRIVLNWFEELRRLAPALSGETPEIHFSRVSEPRYNSDETCARATSRIEGCTAGLSMVPLSWITRRGSPAIDVFT